MRTAAPAVAFFRTTIIVLGASLWAPSSLSVEIDLDALLSEYCEENEGMDGSGGPIGSSFQAPILESCRGPHRFRDVAWSVSSKLGVPAAAAEDFLRGSLLLEDEEEGTDEEATA
jgi:hypothetical protein